MIQRRYQWMDLSLSNNLADARRSQQRWTVLTQLLLARAVPLLIHLFVCLCRMESTVNLLEFRAVGVQFALDVALVTIDEGNLAEPLPRVVSFMQLEDELI